MAALPTGGWSVYGVGWPKSIDSNATASAVGNKEQFLGDIAIIDPTDTPTFSMLDKETWPAPYQEWPIDTLAATATAPSVEGWEFEATALSGRTRYNNVTQAFHRGILVTRRQIQMSNRGATQGVGDEYRYQIGKKLLELNRDINARVVAGGGLSASSITGTTGAGSRTGALRAAPCIVTNVSGAWGTASYHALHRKMDEVGANPDTLLVSSGIKADISNAIMGLPGTGPYGSTPVRRINMDQTTRELTGIVEIIEDDFGRVSIFRDRWLPIQTAVNATATGVLHNFEVASASALVKAACEGAYYLFERAKVKLGIFQPPVHKPLPPNGDYERGFVVAEVAVKVLHASCVGIGGNVTQSAI